MLRVKLRRDLRKDILRGHPWVYQQSLEPVPPIPKSQLCQVIDKKGQALAWALYDPKGILALRILSLEKIAPQLRDFLGRIRTAYHLRQSILNTETTSAYRLLNGEGDLMPGLVCDMYDKVAVLQCDGEGPKEFWDLPAIAEFLCSEQIAKSVVYKGRSGEFETLAGPEVTGPVQVLENGIRFEVKIQEGQKTGFFLDQRDNREYVKGLAKGKKVLNVFSYTGGFSIYAGLGGASKVASLDLSQGALDGAQINWHLNGLDPSKHTSHCGDAFEILKAINEPQDMVIVDPPSMAPSEKHKSAAMQKYSEAFALAARLTKSGGDLVLSSCSSHIQFEDFFQIIDSSLSQARRQGQILRVSGQGADHPFPHACHEQRYLKFVHLVLS